MKRRRGQSGSTPGRATSKARRKAVSKKTKATSSARSASVPGQPPDSAPEHREKDPGRGSSPPPAPVQTPHVDLSGANFQQGELAKAELSEADLHDAHMEGADLSGAVLHGANIESVHARGVDFADADLSEANLGTAELASADLQRADLKQANLRGANLRGCPMVEVDLTGANLDQADLRDGMLDEAVLYRASLTDTRFDGARLRSADLSGVAARGASFADADLSRADFDGADLTYARLDRAVLAGANLKGTNLTGASLLRVDLRGARYDRATTWPQGFDIAGMGLVFSAEENLSISLTTFRPGRPYPLGATWTGDGVNFALFAEQATHVELCLFDRADADEASARIRMPEQTDGIWHLFIPHLASGQLYGYRVFGPYKPERGLRFNANKLLIDPYAKALTGPLRWDDALFGYRVGDPEQDLSFDERSSAPFMPKCVVVDSSFPWGDDRPPRTPLHKTIVYELHVKGFTKLHPGIPEAIRGTYVALGSQVVIDYLKSLGVTAVELMPVHEQIDDRFLVERGLSNYWGYNTLCYFAPSTRFGSRASVGSEVREFKSMVKSLHAAGIEVILDVVYNHTAEGNHLGPTLCYRGIDNTEYYRTVAEAPRYYMDYTGCGNTINMLGSRSLQLMMDSLRYWVLEMHVDGFRFDLAAALMRGLHEADRLSAFFDVISQDPVISQVKLIAEPWDVGPGGYQVGSFPHLWSEWNGKFRDAVRRFWKGDEAQVGELAYRLSGSSDLYQHNGRRPYASINFVAAHDGFTLNDLVTYDRKHNEANQDDNRDGDDHNNSWNCGVEGPTDDPEVLALRARQMRNFMATLLLSQGVPMIVAGDERCRTQRGNNNAYCQDNEISWLDWSLDDRRIEMLEFTRLLVRLRQQHPSLSRRRFFFGRRVHGANIRDIIWLQPNGEEMTDQQWTTGYVRCIGMLLNGQAMHEWAEDGTLVHDRPLLVLLNAHHDLVPFRIPVGGTHGSWELVVDTTAGTRTPSTTYEAGDDYSLGGRALVVLRASETEASRSRPLWPSPAVPGIG